MTESAALTPARARPERRGSDDVVVTRDGFEVRLNHDTEARVGDCRDCRYMVGHVSWWCKNKAAIELHGTAIPGLRDDPCPHWAEAKRHPPPVRLRVRSWWERLWSRP